MKSKATERSFNESWKKFVKHLIVEHLKRCGYNYNFAKYPVDCLHNSREPIVSLWSSYKERKGNALASGADEGRDKLR